MDREWVIREGVLRGKRKPDGSWEFVQVVTLNDGERPEQFHLAASTPAEARRIASRTEKLELERYAEIRRQHHSTTSFNEGGWCGEILEKPPAKFLIDEFELVIDDLSIEQRQQLEADILSLDHSFLTEAKQRAKKDLKVTRNALVQLAKQQRKVESLSRGFRAMANFSPMATPDTTLAQLLFELSENEKAIGENLDELGRDKANITADSLCANSIDIFVRWADSNLPPNERGIAYPNNYKALLRLPKIEGCLDDGVQSTLDGPLGTFIEELRLVLLNQGLMHWDFNVHEPARRALRQFTKRDQFLPLKSK